MAKLFCEKCKRKCRGDVLRVSDKYFHKNCFTCTKCAKSLETGGFFIKDGGFYCQLDYQTLFSAKCNVCHNDLIGEIVTVLNFSFHRHCFKCTTCSIAFNPGDRVTVWKEQFFCPSCIRKQPLSVSSPSRSIQNCNGTALSPISVTDDEGCISAADASPREFSPTQYPTSKYVKLESEETFRLTAPHIKCVNSASTPQESKSILRKLGVNNIKISPRERANISADSGLGERLFDSRIQEDSSHPSAHEQTNGNESSIHPVATPSTTLSVNLSRHSLFSRVPNSDYGRFLNQSYLSQPMLSPPIHQYKRAVPATVANNFMRPKHFHVPENKSRFLPPGTRTASILFGQPNSAIFSRSSAPRSNVNVSMLKQGAKSAFELRGKADGFQSTTSPVNGKSVTNTFNDSPRKEHEATLEARRLACYPGGHERDKTTPAPIERFDWPAPPASAVVLAELMRERRGRCRDQTQMNGVPRGDEFDSQEVLSIDESFDGPMDSSGIGKAILREEAKYKRQCQSQLLDPVSASRSPNAAVEPMYKPRFSTHQFACQPLRPGYTGGRLSGLGKTSSLPVSSFLLNSGRTLDIGGDQVASNDYSNRQTPCNRSYYHSVHALSTQQSHLSNGLASTFRPSCSSVVHNGIDQVHQRDGYPNILYIPTPSAAFHKPPSPAPKVIPYDELKTFRSNIPKGIDRTALETHLSDEEFKRVFRLSRTAFYRLPEWKRNDLKRRVELF